VTKEKGMKEMTDAVGEWSECRLLGARSVATTNLSRSSAGETRKEEKGGVYRWG